ncbi:hypothetical protein LIER_35985 [Lithospermum erythrorhizon]|uniref:Uncharacterized protein n=1 Tax=Lithospermum erythrorhizon TaxID=34254 RepID=A0AAV3P0N5_LITER
MSRRRKAKGKLKLNENRTMIGNKKIPKNVVEIVREFIYNITDDVDDPESENFQKGTHVADIHLRAVETGGASSSDNEGTAPILKHKIKYLESVIQTSLARKYILEARLINLAGEVDPEMDPDVDPDVAGSEDQAFHH